MASHTTDFFSLRQDFKKIVIGQEVEAGKVGTLFLEVLLEALLYKLEILVGIDKALFKAFFAAIIEDTWVLVALVHDIAPFDIDTLETLGL